MKKILLLMLLLPVAWTGAQALNADPEALTKKLPDKALQFIDKHFPNEQVRRVETDYERGSTSYEAKLSNGFELKFDGYGQWTEVDGETLTVPKAIIPGRISNYVEKHYPETRIVSIDNERQHYEVKLSDGKELIFDRNGKFNGRDR